MTLRSSEEKQIPEAVLQQPLQWQGVTDPWKQCGVKLGNGKEQKQKIPLPQQAPQWSSTEKMEEW